MHLIVIVDNGQSAFWMKADLVIHRPVFVKIGASLTVQTGIFGTIYARMTQYMHCNVRISFVTHKPSVGLLGRPTLARKALCYTDEISFFFSSFFYQHIAPTSHLIFTQGQTVRNLASFSTPLANHPTLSRPLLKMHQSIRTLKQKCNASGLPCTRQVWWSWVHAPVRKLCLMKDKMSVYLFASLLSST